MIVEDEEAIADLEKDYLELSGFEVEVANDGETGLKKALENDADSKLKNKEKQNYTPAKWDIEKYVKNKLINNDKSNVNWYFLRYADVLLLYAEALNEWKQGPTKEAYDAINKVRERAYGNCDHNYATVTLKDVQSERRFELAWEAWSRQDDIRFGCFTTAMWPQSNCDRKTDDYLKLLPISQDAWQVNPNLKQNPGYSAFSQ